MGSEMCIRDRTSTSSRRSRKSKPLWRKCRMGNIMRRMMSKEKRQQIIQDLISGKKSVVELGDETRMLILSDIIESMRKRR